MVTMFPSKTMDAYTTEMNRLFKVSQNENQQFNYALTNQSSSSTDSTSPESLSEITFLRQNTSQLMTNPPPPTYEPLTYERYYDTPKASDVQQQRRRPIMGRKQLLLTESPAASCERVQLSPQPKRLGEYRNTVQNDMWFRSPTNFIDNHGCYELFPSENRFLAENRFSPENRYTPDRYTPENRFPSESRPIEYKTPVKTSPTIPNLSPISPRPSLSPNSINNSPIRALKLYKPPKPSNVWPSTSNPDIGRQKMCTFCRKNGETPIVYMTHCVKELVGDRYIVSCPILRGLVCTTCGSSGDEAHTITYCPVLRNNNNGQPLRSTTITLKNTRIKSNGRRRF